MEVIEKNKQLTIAVSKIHRIEFYQNYLNIPEIQKVQTTFLSYQRKCEWLNTHYLLHRLTGIVQTYKYNEYNKPIASASNHRLSISHSEHYTAIALSKTISIGIDIEENGRNFVKIARKFLHNNELAWITNESILHLIWCAKESLFKLLNSASPNFSTDYKTTNILLDKNILFLKYKDLNTYPIHFFKTSEYLLTWTAKI